MANCNYTSRSNYFAVKDREELEKCVSFYPGLKVFDELYTNGEDKGRVAIGSEDPDFSFYHRVTISNPIQVLPARLAALVDIDHCSDDVNETELPYIDEWIWRLLKDGEVIILQEVGAEKLRYLIGSSMALNYEGKHINIDIDDIYEKVKKEWGVEATQATY